MPVAPVLLAGGLMAALALPTSAAPVSPEPGWERVERTAVFSVTSVKQGDLRGHAGNWHTVVVSHNGADGISGVVADWTCPEGVEPNYQDSEETWVCAADSMVVLDDAVDEEGRSLVSARINRPTRNIVIKGDVLATDRDGVTSTGRIHIRGHARGPLTRTVTDAEDGLTRVVVDERAGTRALGRVLGIVIHHRGFHRDTSSLVSVSTYLAVPGRPRPDALG